MSVMVGCDFQPLASRKAYLLMTNPPLPHDAVIPPVSPDSRIVPRVPAWLYRLRPARILYFPSLPKRLQYLQSTALLLLPSWKAFLRTEARGFPHVGHRGTKLKSKCKLFVSLKRQTTVIVDNTVTLSHSHCHGVCVENADMCCKSIEQTIILSWSGSL